MRDRLKGLLHPTVRFFWGLALLGCLVFAATWQARVVLACGGALLAVLAGKRIKISYFAFLVLTIVFFNVLLPVGKVWWRWGPWVLTEGAFWLGVGKGFTFAGLVFFSLASVSRDLELPGRFGALWAKTFSWYEQLMDQRRALKPRALLLSLDRLLERLYPTRGSATLPNEDKPRPAPTRPGGWVLVVTTFAAAVTLAVLR